MQKFYPKKMFIQNVRNLFYLTFPMKTRSPFNSLKFAHVSLNRIVTCSKANFCFINNYDTNYK